MADDDELASAVSDLDDGYLRVLLLLAVRRAQSEEPRRAGFWHALAVTLAGEQEKRRGAAQLDPQAEAPTSAEAAELGSVLDELRQEIAVLEAEMRESLGDLDVAGTTAVES